MKLFLKYISFVLIFGINQIHAQNKKQQIEDLKLKLDSLNLEFIKKSDSFNKDTAFFSSERKKLKNYGKSMDQQLDKYRKTTDSIRRISPDLKSKLKKSTDSLRTEFDILLKNLSSPGPSFNDIKAHIRNKKMNTIFKYLGVKKPSQ